MTMAQETLVAVFDTAADAQAAVHALAGAGVAPADIERHAQHALRAQVSPPATTASRGGFWGALFGGETTTEQNTVYDRTVQSGGDVVTVVLHDSARDGDRVMTILERFGPVDVNARAASYRTAAATPTAAMPRPTGSDEIMQLSEETLAVGKREVDRGTTRVHRFVRTEAVEQSVTLRDETVSVERRLVAAGVAAGPDAFTDRVIEMTESDEVAVVAKTARVREEIVLHKDVVERTETVRDTLRREELEIQKVPGTAAPSTGTVGPPSTGKPRI